MGGAGGVDTQQDLDRLDLLGGDLPERALGHLDLVGRGPLFAPALPERSCPAAASWDSSK